MERFHPDVSSEESNIEPVTSPNAPTALNFTAGDGTRVALHAWIPAGDVKGVVTIAHGLSEHAERYARFAGALAEAGYAVYASDHRGHGPLARDENRLGEFGPDGWNATLGDLAHVTLIAHEAHPGKALFFFGHSMGSVFAQRFIQLHGAYLAGAVLCGSFGAIEGLEGILQMADAMAQGAGAAVPSALQPQMFAGFNAAFEQKTGFEWLSRDESEVRKYVDSPLCGFPLTNGAMATMLHGFADAWRAENEARIPVDLPILIVAGAKDPAGAATGSLAALAERYRALGVRDLTVTFYPDDRHEILNELDRERVTSDLIAWFDGHLSA
ncbi:MAG: alpha/beta hydrolase [Candidatus Eremiobacteraeota bacterium]|nr:alpha/beta hydrolase [Candidatus Eremiobacteraeota bacterium]